jgi:hypothetical protein
MSDKGIVEDNYFYFEEVSVVQKELISKNSYDAVQGDGIHYHPTL